LGPAFFIVEAETDYNYALAIGKRIGSKNRCNIRIVKKGCVVIFMIHTIDRLVVQSEKISPPHNIF
jgi:hypothetical protein